MRQLLPVQSRAEICLDQLLLCKERVERLLVFLLLPLAETDPQFHLRLFLSHDISERKSPSADTAGDPVVLGRAPVAVNADFRLGVRQQKLPEAIAQLVALGSPLPLRLLLRANLRLKRSRFG